MYAAAGADVVFAPGSEDPGLIRRLVSEVPKPLNVLRLRRSTSLESLEELGVRRVTIGGAGYLVALAALERALRGLRDGSYEAWDEIGRPSPEVFQHVSAPRPGD